MMTPGEQSITPTGYNVLTSMAFNREVEGRAWVTKHQIAKLFGSDTRAVFTALQDFEGRGWVIMFRRYDEQTGVPQPTAFRLTDEAPSLRSLLEIKDPPLDLPE